MIIPETEFNTWLESKNLAARTKKEYLWYLSKLNLYNTLTQPITDQFLQAHPNHVVCAFLRNVLTYLDRPDVAHNIPPEDYDKLPRVKITKMKKKPRKIPNIITRQQVHLIEDKMKHECAKIMLLLSYYCALRISELLSLSTSSFNWTEWVEDEDKNGKLYIKGKGDKFRNIPVRSDIMKRLMEWVNRNYSNNPDFETTQPIFPFSDVWWGKLLNAGSIKAINRKVNPHLLRHSFATYLIENGWDIIEIRDFLGHEDISTTQIYAYVSPKRISEKYAKL